MLHDFWENLKRFFRGECAPRTPIRTAMTCRLCDRPGLYPVGRGEWVCKDDSPPFMRTTGRTANGFTFAEPTRLAGDPR